MMNLIAIKVTVLLPFCPSDIFQVLEWIETE